MNQTKTATLTLANKGSAALQLTALSFNSNVFSAMGKNSLPITLDAGGTYQLTIQFAPTAIGAASGTLSITSSDATNSSVSVSLTGAGVSSSATAPGLTVSSGSIAFGDVQINTTATQTISLSSTGSSPVTVNSVTLSGSGFAVSGPNFPLTINPAQSAALEVAFDPTKAGAVTGNMTISSNSSGGPTAIVSLTGTGVTSTYSVQLDWDAPSSSADPVVGYYIYRSPSGASAYQVLNSSSDSGTTYEDKAVGNGQSYDYMVKSVDADGNLSVPSNVTTVAVP